LGNVGVGDYGDAIGKCGGEHVEFSIHGGLPFGELRATDALFIVPINFKGEGVLEVGVTSKAGG
jgi:hypothetical protein